MPQRSRLLARLSLEPLMGVPHVAAHGGEDDHFRIIVALASALSEPTNPLVVDCMSPSTTWKRRRDAFADLLESTQKTCNRSVFAAVVDPDALDVGGGSTLGGRAHEDRWDDAWFKRERRDVFTILLESFRKGGWLLIRPEPRQETTLTLHEHECVRDPDTVPPPSTEENDHLNRALSGISSALQSLVRGLVHTSRISAHSAACLIEASPIDNVEAVVLQTAYDSLSLPAAHAAQRLSILRGPQVLNGVAGPFTLTDGVTTESDHELPRPAVEELLDGGWFALGRDLVQHRFAISNGVREFLGDHVSSRETARVMALHRWLGEREAASLDEELEAHYHAISSGDVNLAVKTARYYGADLRRLARRLSDQKRYAEAADIYRTIVERFDRTDAYAWEYYAYNLALEHRAAIPAEVERTIREAYRKACDYDEDNPLYRGREVGFRARMGEDVQGEFDSYVYQFQQMPWSAVSFFARPVLEALPSLQRKAVAKKWNHQLRRHDKLANFLK